MGNNVLTRRPVVYIPRLGYVHRERFEARVSVLLRLDGEQQLLSRHTSCPLPSLLSSPAASVSHVPNAIFARPLNIYIFRSTVHRIFISHQSWQTRWIFFRINLRDRLRSTSFCRDLIRQNRHMAKNHWIHFVRIVKFPKQFFRIVACPNLYYTESSFHRTSLFNNRNWPNVISPNCHLTEHFTEW